MKKFTGIALAGIFTIAGIMGGGTGALAAPKVGNGTAVEASHRVLSHTLHSAKLTRTTVSASEGETPRDFRFVGRLTTDSENVGWSMRLYPADGSIPDGGVDSMGGVFGLDDDGNFSQQLANLFPPNVYKIQLILEEDGEEYTYGYKGDRPLPNGPITLTITP